MVSVVFVFVIAVLEIMTLFDSGICQKRLWDSEFKAVPYDPVQARSLQDTRAHRMFCHCSLEDKAMADKAMEDM